MNIDQLRHKLSSIQEMRGRTFNERLCDKVDRALQSALFHSIEGDPILLELVADALTDSVLWLDSQFSTKPSDVKMVAEWRIRWSYLLRFTQNIRWAVSGRGGMLDD